MSGRLYAPEFPEDELSDKFLTSPTQLHLTIANTLCIPTALHQHIHIHHSMKSDGIVDMRVEDSKWGSSSRISSNLPPVLLSDPKQLSFNTSSWRFDPDTQDF